LKIEHDNSYLIIVLLFQIPKKTIPWPENIVRRASVNTTGYGGTNAHVVLENINSFLSKGSNGANGVNGSNKINGLYKVNGTNGINGTNGVHSIKFPMVFVLSHQRDDGLRKSAQILKRSLSEPWAEQSSTLLSDLAFTLARKRSHFSYRTAIIASNIKELYEGLDGLVNGQTRSESIGPQPSLCFAFTGIVSWVILCALR